VSSHASALPVGYKIDEYLIGRLLGHGGFGLTYLAQDTNLNSLVAIKEFLPQEFALRGTHSEVIPKSEFDADSYRWGLDRFKEEARALARFKHPNIVRVSRLLEANGTAYMVMDFEPGMTLSQYLKRYGATLEEDMILGMFLPVLDGLEALHRLQLVHRDIKPSNIYVRAYGGPMLIDFGAVRQAIGAASRNLTSLVTPGYAPIEQYSSDGRQGAWSDLYAVGASIYYCMFGHAPADAARRSAALSDAGDDPYANAVTRGKEGYSKELLECVDWALQFRVRDRPQSANELRERLLASPVQPRIIELPESMNEVPELQHGVLSAPTQPAMTNRPVPTALLPGSVSIPVSGESTVVSLPTARGPDSLNPFIEGTRREDATQVLRGPPLSDRLRLQFRRFWGNVSAFLAARQISSPNTQGPNTQNPSTLTSRLTQHLREPRSVRILVTAVVVAALTATIITYNRRMGGDKQLYDAAVAANTVAGYQHYLQACRSCAHRAEAEAAVASLQKSAQAQVAELQSQFKSLLGKGQLKAPADPNAGSVLHALEAAAPADPHIAEDRSSLEAALKAQDKKAAEKKALRPAPVRRVAKAAPKPKPASSTPAAPQQDVAAAGEVLPKAVYAPTPKYPSDAKGVSGWVDVEFNVNVDGSTSSAEVVGSQPQGVFDSAALHAVHTWVFSPDTQNGVRTRKRIRMRIQFKP
jgi:TonB family protein